MQQCRLSSDNSLEQQPEKLRLFGWVEHLDGCLMMIFQLPAQIMLSLLTKVHKKTRFTFLSGCTKRAGSPSGDAGQRGERQSRDASQAWSAVSVEVTRASWAMVG